MDKLNRAVYGKAAEPLPEKVLQFGEGNFLRAFVDFMIGKLNEAGRFNGGITVVQPIERGMVDMVNAQDGLYTVILRGLEGGKEVSDKSVVTAVRRGINPYTDFAAYAACAANPELRVVVSNTTEAGIIYAPEPQADGRPQTTFPAKVCAFLYDRYKAFGGDPAKGLIFIPCELIDNNGTELRACVLKYAKDWNLGESFVNWVEAANYFTNTLVDRIVTGYPRDEAEALWAELGYRDDLLDTAEIFHYWVIEYPKQAGADKLSAELPFSEIGLNVMWTDDVTPYKARKVRILNGAHTSSVLAAFLAGHDTVGEMMKDEAFVGFLRGVLFDEVIPGIVKYLPYDNLKAFADSVFDRFGNPFIKHYISSIALNSVSKFKARVLPSITAYADENGALPKGLTFALAALCAFYRGERIEDGALVGVRGGVEYKVQDDLPALEFFRDVWAGKGAEKADIAEAATAICRNEALWGRDLTQLHGFDHAVAHYLYDILNTGVKETMARLAL